jgi:EAL and modified HD-GYP domain-containing signal transduction protein
MLQAVSKDTLDYGEINDILKTDMSLSYRMLKLANSPFFGFRSEITSILHAITLLGSQGVKRFVSLIALSATTEGKPSELALISLTRARMGEEIASSAGLQTEASPLFITGLFSMLDAMLDCTMEEAVDQLPISQDIKAALLGEKNKLRNLLDVIIAYEKGDWTAFSEAAALAGIREDAVPSVYTAAIAWANEVYQSM